MSDSKRKGWYITPDGERIDMPEPENEDGTFSLKQLQEAVGGYIEVVQSSLDMAKGRVILADEEGLIKQLPINIAGTVMCGRPVVGNIVVIDEECWS